MAPSDSTNTCRSSYHDSQTDKIEGTVSWGDAWIKGWDTILDDYIMTFRRNAAEKRTKKGLGFGRLETTHIILGVTVLTISFALALSNGMGNGMITSIPAEFAFFLPMSLVAVSTGFMFHEIAHKLMAQHFGLWSEFRASFSGLGFGLILAVLTSFVFALPGAVHVGGYVREEENGKIGAAGPLMNIFIAFLAIPFITFGGLIGYVAGWVAIVNSFLALFNLAPFKSLDGEKVARWNIGVYLLMVVAALGAFIVAQAPGILL